MALMRSWAVGVLVLVVTEYIQVRVVYDHLVGPAGVGSFAAALALVHVPNLLCVVLATWAAARVHPEPWRRAPARHVAAACAVPAAGQLLVLSLRPDLTNVSGLALWMSTGVLLAGCSMGLLLDSWWEGREA
ncbi:MULTISPECIES: hypothetical protein [unclassified Streptomyces]|uniref:hypothetical protein n=1 Tax=unclassified Streptomyces TaxID=2593676 RepID=UPI002255EFB3|nr:MULTISPECIES: hypothetical protein [unclassified Streptomyces]MCX5050726.1 hypothetical protein [Streptomyces sp. NBC_00474]MCX5061102.1 hypothetical protein [Streptomyces sp. NBC_00452]MCX5293273.1 hypothetical protein [Streptomyces sp. NBC_00183]